MVNNFFDRINFQVPYIVQYFCRRQFFCEKSCKEFSNSIYGSSANAMVIILNIVFKHPMLYCSIQNTLIKVSEKIKLDMFCMDVIYTAVS